VGSCFRRTTPIDRFNGRIIENLERAENMGRIIGLGDIKHEMTRKVPFVEVLIQKLTTARPCLYQSLLATSRHPLLKTIEVASYAPWRGEMAG